MSTTPPLTQFIGRTERTLRALLEQVLVGTGGTFHQWVAVNLTATGGQSIDRFQLIGRVGDAVQIDDASADAVVDELVAEGLLREESESVVSLTDAGRERYVQIRDTIDQVTGPLFADIPADDEATTRRVLSTILERAQARNGAPR